MRKNNFDFVRLALAIGILLVHVAGVSGGSFDFIFRVLNGDSIVKCFFVISGYLVTKSYYREQGSFFFIKRALRVLPGYYVALLFLFILGTILTSMPLAEFLKDRNTLSYIFYNAITLNFMQPWLPGVFEHNPLRAMNGSLWTIKSEIILYISMPIYYYLYKRLPIVTYLFISTASLLWIYYFSFVHVVPASRTLVMQFIGLASFYYGGSLFASLKVDESKAVTTVMIVSVLLYASLSRYAEVKFIIEVPLIVSLVLFVCNVIPGFANLEKVGDLSYGVYLYNFPVIQILCNYGIFRDRPYLGLVLSIAITLMMACMSWYMVEKRCLGLKSRVKPAL